MPRQVMAATLPELMVQFAARKKVAAETLGIGGGKIAMEPYVASVTAADMV